MTINNFTTNLYSIQQFVNILLINQITQISFFSFISAFVGGIFTSISPCVLSSIPIAALYINRKTNKIYNTSILISGLCSSLLGIGVFSILLKPYASIILEKIPFIWPILITSVGMSLLGITATNPFTGNINNKSTQKHKDSTLNTYLLGLGLGITISPCSTPITITLIAWINTTQNYTIGLSLLLIYTIGYILPLLISIVSLNTFGIINKLSQNSSIIMNTLGCMTITVGSYSLCKELFGFL
uniref:Thiol:disulfi de interchange protein n=1 Tax=Helminthora furcellata TaxID=1884666 RepID=A0A1G4NQW6_9FLOR|nr:Thiol:disulfi de interchange protein [Helminthora furcellata]SCW21048.1 Thiol:disulfi de interchange protein [Helminthora furcellata]SCW23908.1 Thiol:disulfi de interchange protein [Helminthora furcellata]